MRKRSRYKPKGTMCNPVQWVINGFKPLSSVGSEAVTLKIKNHDAMDYLRRGEGMRHHADIVITALNIAEALAMQNIGDEYRDEIRAAQDALLEALTRNKTRIVFKEPELAAINLAMEVHDAQLDACTIGELEKALVIIDSVIKNKKARVVS